MERESRFPDELERRRVEQTVNDIIRRRRFAMITGGIIALVVAGLLSLCVGGTKVQGEYQTRSGILLFLFFVVIIAVVIVLYSLYLKKWKDIIAQRTYRVIDASVVDKERSSGKYTYYQVEVKYEDGEKETFSVTEDTYERASLGTAVMIVNVNVEKYFIDRSDLVINEDRPAASSTESYGYDYDDEEEDEEWD